MPKIKPSELITAIVVGGKDPAENQVVNVLARNNEYVIYEIEDDDVNNRMKLLVDGLTDESEAAISTRFNTIKQKYIEAKGLLGKSSNYGMMKQRIAHTLSTCLSADNIDGEQEFSDLIATISKEHEEMVTNRAIYLTPCFTSTLVLFALSLVVIEQRIDVTTTWMIITSLLAASLGGTISILSKANSLNFEEFKTKKHYFLLGLERIFLSFIAGAIIFIAIKSEVLFPTSMSKNYWAMMMIIVVSGFSESFVPGILDKVNKEVDKKSH